MNNKIRLHLISIPHTITSEVYSHCAFTGKVKRFSPMMKSVGFEVYHYGIESSNSGADKNIDLLTIQEWTDLKIKSFMYLDKKLTLNEAIQKNNDETKYIGELGNWDTPLVKEFNKRLKIKLIQNYRDNKTDIVCIPFGKNYEDAICDLNFTKVETGIGYPDSYQNFRIFESYSWLSHTCAKENINPPNYWFVAPNYYDINNFKLSLIPNKKKIGFLGRITSSKGLNIIVEIAKKFPNLEFVICGQGNPNIFLTEPNIIYKPPIYGSEISDYLGSCIAVLCPTEFIEPFCGVSVEAQLCGTPVISTDHGAFADNIENFKTGLRCHTLADYCYGIQLALDNIFDRKYIHERACKLFDMYKIAYKYEYIFKCILDVHIPENNGWYANESYIKLLK